MTLKATPSGAGAWSVAASGELVDGKYTAQATQLSSLGNAEGKTAPEEFEIFTKPPTVTLEPLSERSKENQPTFKGTASEPGQVTVHVFKGGEASGTEAAKLTATVGPKGEWSVSQSSQLADETYTAVATEPSAIGNEEGQSKPSRTFEIDTKPPELTCEPPQGKSSNATPAFSGASNESGRVMVHIIAVESAEEVATLEAHPTGKGTSFSWATAHVNPELLEGVYKEVATQSSGIGNAAASCGPHEFEVAKVPTVSLNSLELRSNNPKPSFSGTASEKAPVKVVIYEGPTAEGKIAATVEGEVTGSTCSLKVPCKWSVAVTKGLFEGMGAHVYTAVAEQTSKLTSLEGISEPRTFEVDTRTPRVAIAQIGPQLGEHEKQPTLTGTATEPKEEVTVHLYKGGEPKGEEVASMKAAVNGGRWAVQVPSALKEGTYTALATQPSAIKNLTGESLPMTFEVVLKSPVVTLKEVPTPTSDVAPSFSGTATDPKEKVLVRVFAGGAPEGQEVARVEAEVANQQWSSVSLAIEGESLQDGEYTAIAEQKSFLKNKPGISKAISFTVQVQPPSVSEVSASANRTAALVNATVDANGGRLGVCDFEYGTTTEYGKTAQCAYVIGTPGAENPGCAFSFPPSDRLANSRLTTA